jgi:hypothetical protein
MRLTSSSVNKFIVFIFVAAVVGLGLYMMNTKEGFNKACTKMNCNGEYEWVGGKCVLTCQNIWKGSSPVMDRNCKPMWSCKDTGYSTNPTRNEAKYIKTACKD